MEAERKGSYKTIDPNDVWGSFGLKKKSSQTSI
ncbi:hypothetical protein [Flavobacterium ardleyense]